MNTALIAGLFEVSHSTTTTKNLSFDDKLSIFTEVLSNLCGFFGVESDVSDGNRDLEGMKEGTGLVLVELEASHGESVVVHEGTVEELFGLVSEHLALFC